MTKVRRYYTEGETHNPRDIPSSGKLPEVPKSVRKGNKLAGWVQALLDSAPRRDGINTFAKGVGQDIPSKGIGHHLNKEEVEEERERRRRIKRELGQKEREWPSEWEEYIQEYE